MTFHSVHLSFTVLRMSSRGNRRKRINFRRIHRVVRRRLLYFDGGDDLIEADDDDAIQRIILRKSRRSRAVRSTRSVAGGGGGEASSTRRAPSVRSKVGPGPSRGFFSLNPKM